MSSHSSDAEDDDGERQEHNFEADSDVDSDDEQLLVTPQKTAAPGRRKQHSATFVDAEVGRTQAPFKEACVGPSQAVS